MLVICDTSPITNLATINLLHLLPDMFGKVVIPRAVFDEITVKGKGKPGSQEVLNANWILVRICQDQTKVEEFQNY